MLTPEEARVLASDIFNREFAKLGADWTKRPITLTLAGIQNGVDDLRPKPPSETLIDQAKRLLALREEVAAEEQRIATQRMSLARQALARPADTDRVMVPESEWKARFEESRHDR